MRRVKPAIEAVGGRCLARGGPHKVYEGDWEPKRLGLFEFPSMEALDALFMRGAHRLFQRNGFSDCPAYTGVEVPAAFHSRWRFLERDLIGA